MIATGCHYATFDMLGKVLLARAGLAVRVRTWVGMEKPLPLPLIRKITAFRVRESNEEDTAFAICQWDRVRQ
jgi:hypothetical protein